MSSLCGVSCSLPLDTFCSWSDRVLNSMPVATSSSETPPSKKHMLYLSGLYAASTVCDTSLALSLLFHRGPHDHHRDHCHSVLLLPSSDVGIGCRLCLHDVWSQSRCVCLCEINWQEMCDWIFMKCSDISTYHFFRSSRPHWYIKVSFLFMDLRKFIVL